MLHPALHRGSVSPYKVIEESDFGGLATKDAPLVPRRNAVVSENVSYHNRRIVKALGDVAVLDNAVGAKQIETFSTNTDWTGGVLESGAGNYVPIEAESDDEKTGKGLHVVAASRRVSQAGVGTASMEKTYSTALVLGQPAGDPFDAGFDAGFGQDPLLVERSGDIFHVWRKPLALAATVTGYQLRLRFETSSGNYFQVVLAGTGTGEERLEFATATGGVGLYRRVRRYLFTKTGTPDWASIGKIRFELEVTAGTGTITVAIDNLYHSPGLVQDLFQFRRSVPPNALSKEEYAVSAGQLYRNDGKHWVLSGLRLEPQALVNSITNQDRRFLADGVTSPQKIMPDGTIYRMGIANPPKQVRVTQIANGQLATQKVYVIVKFFSKTTGIESGVDDRVGTYVSLTGPNAGLRVSNIPVSVDPQVTHVRLFLRAENFSNAVFYRASGDVDGEVANGVTTFDVTSAVTEIELFEVMDEDTDYPAYLVDAGNPTPITGTVAAATSSTITLAADAPSTDNALNGVTIKITGGTGADQRREIVSYVGASKLATLGSNWSVTPDATSTYATVPVAAPIVREGHPLFFAEHGGYMMTVLAERPSVLRFSQFRQPEYWPLDDEIPLGEDDNDVITAVVSGRNTALAFKRDAVFPVTSVGEPAGLIASSSIAERGAVGQRAVWRVADDIYWANESGIYWFDPALRLRHATYEAQPTWDGLWDPNRQDRMVAVELRSKSQVLLFGASSGSLPNNRAWVVNYRRWEGGRYQRQPSYDTSIYTTGADVATAVEDMADAHRTWFAREGVVYQIDMGVSRDGRGFKMRHRTGLWAPTMGGKLVCRWPWLDVAAKVSGDADLVVDVFYAGAIVADASTLADLQGQSAPLGSFVLGTSALGSGAYVYKKLRLKPRRARYVQFEVSHDGRAEVEVLSLNPHYQPTTVHGNF